MKDSPFIFGKTVSIHSFTDREVESKKLQNNLLYGINTTIISPRRWGKSSLVEKVIGNIRKKEKKVKTVIIDLFYVSNEEEFLEIFAREIIKASSSKWQEWLNNGKTFFKMLVPKMNIGVDPMSDFSISFDWKELKKHSSEVFNLPETIAKEHDVRFIVCLDEFQNIASFADYENFEKKMRSVWQRHKSVTYCLYGSKRHMMADIFNNPSKPFYRFGDIMMLSKIETQKWVSFIMKGFESTGKQISAQVAGKIPVIMKNHSWYVQQLAHYTWVYTSRTATEKEIIQALNELIQTNTPLYLKEIETISATQLNFLKAVSGEVTQFTSAVVMHEFHLGTPRNVSKNKAILVNNDLIQEVNGKFEFVDPAFELWFRKQYLNQPIRL